jgi:hypothetical protein
MTDKPEQKDVTVPITAPSATRRGSILMGMLDEEYEQAPNLQRASQDQDHAGK